MRKVARSKKFKKSFKKRNFSDDEMLYFNDILYKLVNDIELDQKYKDHQLKGSLKDFRECHIRPDLLLIYRINENILELVDIGTHSELFR